MITDSIVSIFCSLFYVLRLRHLYQKIEVYFSTCLHLEKFNVKLMKSRILA